MTQRPPIRTFALLCAAATLCAQTTTQTPTQTKTPASTANDHAFSVPHEVKPKPHVARPEQPSYSFDTIVLDPAHGGSDTGAQITDSILEKDVDLEFGNLLKQMLTSRGFNVVMTRTTDTITPKAPPPALDADGNPIPQPPPKPVDIPLDQRVETANRARAFACLILHASNGGHGVHLFTSSLSTPAVTSGSLTPIVPWDTAQTAALANSERLAGDLSTAVNNIRIPLVNGRSSVRPIDSMTCPAIAVELAPLTEGDSETPASNQAYQQRVAEALVSGLVTWQNQAKALEAAAEAARAIATPAETPARKPRAKPVAPAGTAPAHTPAPIIRRTPPATTTPPAGAQR